MTVRATMETLAPAMLAGFGGVAGEWIWSHPAMTVGAAVLGAAVGAVLFAPDPVSQHASEGSPLAPAPVQPPTPIEPLLDALPGAAMMVGVDRVIRHANAEAVSMFGLPGQRDLPVSMLRSRRLLDGIGRVLQNEAPAAFEFTLSRGFDMHLKAHIQCFGTLKEVLVAIEDHTHTQRARESHRDFVANASHELKTPLAAVSGIIETLLGHARQDPVATERFLTLLSGQTIRMTRLIEDLLSLNRVELNERVEPDEPQDLGRLLSEVVDALHPIAEVADVSLDFRPPAERIIGRADRDEISQLFRNLIDNAIKYGGAGTTVGVTMQPGADEDADMISVSVRDQGPGIAREHLPRLTERFYRVNVKRSREKGGTGLGLAICKHITNRHRGRLEIQSKEGEGSVFTVWLPVMAVETPVERAQPGLSSLA